MALEARELGFDTLAAAGVPAGEYYGVAVHPATVVRGMTAREAVARAHRLRRDGHVVFIEAQDNGFNRAVLEAKAPHVLSGLHAADRHAFDHVAARIASDNGIAMDISLEPILRQRGIARQKALVRYLDLVMLSQKIGFPLVLSTHARSVLEMRSAREFGGIASLLGLGAEEAGQAMGTLRRLLQPDEPVRVVP
jgi:ribonuclease P/MRP protein subunit RPP1